MTVEEGSEFVLRKMRALCSEGSTLVDSFQASCSLFDKNRVLGCEHKAKVQQLVISKLLPNITPHKTILDFSNHAGETQTVDVIDRALGKRIVKGRPILISPQKPRAPKSAAERMILAWIEWDKKHPIGGKTHDHQSEN